MRKGILLVATTSILIAGPALAQGRGGGAGGAGGGLGVGRGAGPPISAPGLAGGGMGTRDLARGIADQQGQFGRDFAAQQHLTATERQAMAQQHRSDAMALAQAVQGGAHLPDSAAGRIRTALKEDIDAWREQFTVDRKAWQAMRDQWLLDRSSLTAEQWAMRRADWFAARDAWIAAQKSTAMARRNN